ncbi:hypothetical protein GOODEAATRI_033073, partial [Goodea atripinnis]
NSSIAMMYLLNAGTLLLEIYQSVFPLEFIRDAQSVGPAWIACRGVEVVEGFGSDLIVAEWRRDKRGSGVGEEEYVAGLAYVVYRFHLSFL